MMTTALSANDAFTLCVSSRYEFLAYRSQCIAVRDRQTQTWEDDHFAIDEQLSLVPRRHCGQGMTRWALRVTTFGNHVQIGALERVETAPASLIAQARQHLGLRYRFGGPEGELLPQASA